ncbi:MAG: lysophospholipid acyltransferase family protein [Acidobacteriota bacterium]
MIASRLAAGVVGGAILGLRATISIAPLHAERYRDLKSRRVPFVFALWHGRMVLPILLHRHQGVVTMASQSKDGEIIARWLVKNGFLAARGSTTRGGGAALMEMIRQVGAGHPAALTVDGPKGPPRVVQPGILRLTRETGAWILPISGASERPRFLRSWDRYLVPRPFSRNVVSYGEPFPVPETMPDEEACRRIGEALDAATLEADAAVGVVPPEPWRS